MLNSIQALSIKQKMLLGFMVIFTIVIAIGLIISSSLFGINRNISHVIKEENPVMIATLQISDMLKDTVSSLSLYMLSKEKYHQTQYEQKLAQQKQRLKQLKTQYANTLTESSTQLIAQIENDLSQLSTLQNQLFSLANNNLDNFPAMRYSEQHLSPKTQSILQNINSLISAEQEEERDSPELAQKLFNQFYTLRYDWNKVINGVRGYLSFRTAALVDEIQLYNDAFSKQLNTLNQQYADDFTLEQTDAIEQLLALQKDYDKHLLIMQQIHASDKWRQDAFLVRTQLTPLLKLSNHHINQLVNQQQQNINTISANLIEKTNHTTFLIIGLLCIAGLSIVFLYRVLTKDIINPISNTVDVSLTAISEVVDSFLGGGHTPLETASSRDEIGKVSETFQLLSVTLQQAAAQQTARTLQLQEKVEKILDVVRQAAIGNLTGHVSFKGDEHIDHLAAGVGQMIDNLNTLVLGLQHSGHQVSSSVVDIATTAKQQEATVAEQAATTHEIMSSSKTISQTAHNLLDTMNHVSKVTLESTEAANNGHSALTRMEQTMEEINTASTEITAKLSVLNEKANNINSVITIINKVADQTNLLSLNAAIEAEKAGEYGSGFSVVASEIRRLSDQTTEATWDIDQTVKEMQSAVSAGVMGMDQFAAKMRRGIEDAHHVGDQLAHIINHVEALAPQFQAVHTGMQAQTESAQQISEAMEQLGEAAQQTADSLRTSNRAIQQLNETAQNLNEQVSSFEVKT